MAPTTGRIFPLCQPFARRTDQQPKAIARKMAPRNLTASSFTGQGQRPMDWLGSTKKVAPMRRLISERMSRKRREYLPKTLGRNSDIAIHQVPLHQQTCSRRLSDYLSSRVRQDGFCKRYSPPSFGY